MRKFLAVLVASSLFLGASAFADVAVGIIDLPSILQNSPQVQAIQQKLQTQFKPEQDKIIAAQNNIRAEAQQLSAPAVSKLTDAQQVKLKDTMAADQKALQDMVVKFQQDVGTAQDAAMKTLIDEVDAAVKTVAEKDKLDIVLLKPAVVYASNATDITQQVLAALPK